MDKDNEVWFEFEANKSTQLIISTSSLCPGSGQCVSLLIKYQRPGVLVREVKVLQLSADLSRHQICIFSVSLLAEG